MFYISTYIYPIVGFISLYKSFSIDESLFTHGKNRMQVWIIGAINTTTKEFRIEPIKERYSELINTFISSYIDKGNHIICDGWRWRFWLGINSTSHIEALWNDLIIVLFN